VRYKPAIGEQWYVKSPEHNYLITLDIIDVTASTIEVKRVDIDDRIAINRRYHMDSLAFIERIDK
jgi:hypothetical protein